MRCLVLYKHPVTGNQYCFVRFVRKNNDELKPVGCFTVLRHENAFVFPAKYEAMKVVRQLRILGYRDPICVKYPLNFFDLYAAKV